MPPFRKENFSEVIGEVAASDLGTARVIKSPEGDYWYQIGKTSYEDMAQAQGYTPIDAFVIGARPHSTVVFIMGGSHTLQIRGSNPERNATMKDMENFAEGTQYSVKLFE